MTGVQTCALPISFNLQSKLLRFLQSNEFYRVGSTKKITVNVRVVAATNLALEEQVHANLFRLDLYNRLNEIGRASCRERV